MDPSARLFLGTGEKTLYSDERWDLVVIPGSGEVWLEARYDSEAPDRTGYPRWAHTEFCLSQGRGTATCRVPYDDAAHLLAAAKPSFVPEAIWAKALVECRKQVSSSED